MAFMSDITGLIEYYASGRENVPLPDVRPASKLTELLPESRLNDMLEHVRGEYGVSIDEDAVRSFTVQNLVDYIEKNSTDSGRV